MSEPKIGTEPDYDSLTAVRMAIVERDDRLAVLMPQIATMEEVDRFRGQIEAAGWPMDRVILMVGPEALAVVRATPEEQK